MCTFSGTRFKTSCENYIPRRREVEGTPKWLRDRGGKQEKETAQSSTYTGAPNYSKRGKKEKADPNGYLRAKMFNGGVPGIIRYRCGANPETGAASIRQPVKLGTQNCLNAVVNRSMVDETIRLLLSTLSEGPQVMYLENWEIWTRFCSNRNLPPWLDTNVHNWDQELLSFLTWEHVVMKNGGGTLAARFSAIRFLHLIEGKGDFEGKAFRVRALIEAVQRRKGVNRRLPINPEMLSRGKRDLNLDTPTGSEIRATLMLGFHFALRIGEIENLEDREISFEGVDGKKCVTIHIRGSKTDQCKLGVRRTLVMTGCVLCPVNGIAQWLDMKSWHPLSTDKVCTASIAAKVNRFLENLASECGMGPNRVSTHSMRAGCATTLYANGVDPIDMQR